ncbi:MAG: PQQ-binding-like beta-propeller repeat protein [Bacteroidota bacterium]
MKIVLLVAFLTGIFASCERSELPQEEDGVIIRESHIWKTHLTQGNYLGSNIESPVIYKDKLLVPGINNEKNFFYQVDIGSGEILDKMEYFEENSFLIFDVFQNKNKLVIVDGYDNYCLDLDELDYRWRFDIRELMSYPFSWTSGINDLFFIFGIPRKMSDTSLPYRCGYIGNVNTGELELFLVPDLGDLPEPDPNEIPDVIVGVDWIEPFYADKQLYLLVYYGKQYVSVNGKISQSYMGLYDYAAKQWIYEKEPLGRVSWVEGKPIIEESRVYHTLYSHVECRNVFTGDIIWSVTDSISHNPSGFCMSENNIIVFEEDFNKKVTAYSKTNGSPQWSTPSHGSISIMNELNGVVYFTSIGDGRLHAIDANTGEYLWRLIAPDEDKAPGAFFKTMCYAIPGKKGEKGKIIAARYLSAICHEAIR